MIQLLLKPEEDFLLYKWFDCLYVYKKVPHGTFLLALTPYKLNVPICNTVSTQEK